MGNDASSPASASTSVPPGNSPAVAPAQPVAAKAAVASPAPGRPAAASPVTAPQFQISSLGATSRNQWFKGLIYGGNGMGKTVLCASAVDVPSMRDILVVSPEGGEMSILEDRDRVHSPELIDTIAM